MSKPSAKRGKRSKPKGPRNKEDPGADQFRKMVHGLLVGVKGWGKSLEAMSRQQYSPAAMQSVVSDYMQMFTIMAQLTRIAANLEVEGEEATLQPSLLNAANVLTFFQGPVLDGVLQERDPAAVLVDFVDLVNKKIEEHADGSPEGCANVPPSLDDVQADQGGEAVESEAPLHDNIEGDADGEEENE